MRFGFSMRSSDLKPEICQRFLAGGDAAARRGRASARARVYVGTERERQRRERGSF